MNQRLFNLSKWQHVEEGACVEFRNPRRRKVELDVNCPGECFFYILQNLEDIESNPERVADRDAGRRQGGSPSGSIADRNLGLAHQETDRGNPSSESPQVPTGDGREVAFLALCKGRDRLEFYVEGPFGLVVEGAPCSIYTADSTDISTEIVGPVILTKIANRRQRNPHLELIEYQMRVNQTRMMAQLEEESARRIEALERKMEAYAPQRDQRALVAKPAGPSGEASESDNRAAPDQASGERVEDAGEKRPRSGGRKERATGLGDLLGEDRETS